MPYAMDAKENQGTTASPFAPSYVEVGGTKFFSDRFYLNRAASDGSDTSSLASSAYSLYNKDCSCGARKPPPLFDRAKLVSSLDLEACILATYVVDLRYLAKDFPTLCGPNSTVPTLLLHGHKGLPKKWEKSRERQDVEDDSSVEECDINMVPEEGWRRTQSGELSSKTVPDNLGDNFYVSQVLPRWLPPKHRPSWSKGGSWRQTHPSAKTKRVRKQGVHHPKYMILFCKDGSVVVLVSTSNLTKQSSTDATWCQRFEPVSSTKKKTKSSRRRNGTDFGAVLGNFLQNQSYATRDEDILPEEFLEKFLHMTMADFEAKYDWSTSQVHLIATCPGEYEGRSNVKHLRSVGKNREFLYGRQRIADIISRLASDTQEDCPLLNHRMKWFPESLLSGLDRLLLQPTSFGARFKQKDMADIARSYLGLDESKQKEPVEPLAGVKRRRQNDSDNQYSEQDLVERLDIVWPSQRLLEVLAACKKQRKSTRSPRSVLAVSETEKQFGMVQEAQKAGSGALFMSSEAFNSIDMSCLSQMVMYEPSIPEQRDPLCPHIKSVARRFDGNIEDLRREFGVGKAEDYFSYFLLTSACLSHGAQGKVVDAPGVEADTLSYSNFELGVLFCSRLTGNKESDRLYCWRPECSCAFHGGAASSYTRGLETEKETLIHLPIPYVLRPRPYQLDRDETDFVETPFFHQVTEISGHMRSFTDVTQSTFATESWLVET